MILKDFRNYTYYYYYYWSLVLYCAIIANYHKYSRTKITFHGSCCENVILVLSISVSKHKQHRPATWMYNNHCLLSVSEPSVCRTPSTHQRTELQTSLHITEPQHVFSFISYFRFAFIFFWGGSTRKMKLKWNIVVGVRVKYNNILFQFYFMLRDHWLKFHKLGNFQ